MLPARQSAAARYVALNRVRARMVDRAEQWHWSSTAAHLAGEEDELVEVTPLLERYCDFSASSAARTISRRHAGCACREPPAGLWGQPSGWRRWRSGVDAGSLRKSEGPSRDFVHLVNCHRNSAHSPFRNSSGSMGVSIVICTFSFLMNAMAVSFTPCRSMSSLCALADGPTPGEIFNKV